MDIHFLESFISVAECGSFAEAARRLSVSPATLAQRLRALEKSLGHPLVERAGRTVHATSSGLAVLPHARKLVEAARNLSAIAAGDVPSWSIAPWCHRYRAYWPIARHYRGFEDALSQN